MVQSIKVVKTSKEMHSYQTYRLYLSITVKRKFFKEHFSSLCTNNDVPDRKFWDTVKPFLNDKGSYGSENITLLEDGEIIREGYITSKIFKNHYVGIIENIAGKKQEESQVTNINDMS